MSDSKKRYVYREVAGRELEKVTSEGWEFVENRTGIGPFGPFGFYIVRRDFEPPTELDLHRQIDELKTRLSETEARLDQQKVALERIKKHSVTIRDGKSRTKSELEKLIHLVHYNADNA